MDLRSEFGFKWPDVELRTGFGRYVKSSFDAFKAAEYCREKRVAIQAGGHCGLWAKRLAEKFDAVYTFEPDAHNFKALMANVTERNIFAYRGVLGECSDFVGLYHNDKNTGGHWVEGTGDIPVFAIDKFNFKAVDLIILDIEGYELHALHGAQRTIEKFKPVIMLEDNGCAKLKGGYDPIEIENFLIGLGYKCAASVNTDKIWVYYEGCVTSINV